MEYGKPRSSSTGGRRLVLPQPFEKRSAAQAGAPGGLGLIAAGCSHHPAEQPFGGATRKQLRRVVDIAMRAWPE